MLFLSQYLLCGVQALSKYSETIASTKKLRNEIESKKREKQVFDGLSKKREKEIADRKRKMAKIVEESNYAYEARYLICFLVHWFILY